MIGRSLLAGLALVALAPSANALDGGRSQEVDLLIAAHARANGVPEELVHRIVRRESRYNPRAVGRGGAMGLMQIKHPTARALGYAGPSSGLLDANTNLTYGVRYLAGAYRVAGGDSNRAVSYYARGYYYAARRKGMAKGLAYGGAGGLAHGEAGPAVAEATPAGVETTGSVVKTIFAPLSFAAAQPVDRESSR